MGNFRSRLRKPYVAIHKRGMVDVLMILLLDKCYEPHNLVALFLPDSFVRYWVVACPVLEFLLFPGVPATYILHVSCNTTQLYNVVTTTLRAYWLVTLRAICDCCHYFVRAVTMIKWAHQFDVSFSTLRAGRVLFPFPLLSFENCFACVALKTSSWRRRFHTHHSIA